MTKTIMTITENKTEDKPIFRITCNSGTTHNIELNLEPELWMELYAISIREQSSLHAVCTAVYMTKPSNVPLDIAIRFFIVDYFRWAAIEEGYVRAEHSALCATRDCKPSVH